MNIILRSEVSQIYIYFAQSTSIIAKNIDDDSLQIASETLPLSLPTSPIGDVIADCQRRRSATWTPSLTLFKSLCLQTLCSVQSFFFTLILPREGFDSSVIMPFPGVLWL